MVDVVEGCIVGLKRERTRPGQSFKRSLETGGKSPLDADRGIKVRKKKYRTIHEKGRGEKLISKKERIVGKKKREDRLNGGR